MIKITALTSPNTAIQSDARTSPDTDMPKFGSGANRVLAAGGGGGLCSGHIRWEGVRTQPLARTPMVLPAPSRSPIAVGASVF